MKTKHSNDGTQMSSFTVLDIGTNPESRDPTFRLPPHPPKRAGLNELFTINVDLGTRIEPIIIYQGQLESPEEVASNFCKMYGFDKEAESGLTKEIYRKLVLVYDKSDTPSQRETERKAEIQMSFGNMDSQNGSPAIQVAKFNLQPSRKSSPTAKYFQENTLCPTP